MIDTTLNDAVRPAPGVDDLRAAQPVPRGDGGGAASTGSRPRRCKSVYVSTADRRAGAAVGVRHLRPDQHAARRQPPGPVRRVDDLVQPARPTCRCRRPRARSTTRCARIGVPDTVHGTLPGQRARVPGVAREPAVADPRRAAHRLHRARRALRELRASDHDPVDAALGRRRRAARAACCSTPSSRSSRSSA